MYWLYYCFITPLIFIVLSGCIAICCNIKQVRECIQRKNRARAQNTPIPAILENGLGTTDNNSICYAVMTDGDTPRSILCISEYAEEHS